MVLETIATIGVEKVVFGLFEKMYSEPKKQKTYAYWSIEYGLKSFILNWGNFSKLNLANKSVFETGKEIAKVHEDLLMTILLRTDGIAKKAIIENLNNVCFELKKLCNFLGSINDHSKYFEQGNEIVKVAVGILANVCRETKNNKSIIDPYNHKYYR